ncbi:MAG: hypothetical protein ABI685_06230 [Ferruginibacter sp.]
MKYIISLVCLSFSYISFGQFQATDKSITKSKYLTEIRLQVTHFPFGIKSERTLFFDSSNWHASENGEILVVKKDLSLLIDELNKINPGELKSQSELNLDSQFGVDDGVHYLFSYKNGDKIKYVTFDNPELFQKQYPKVKEFEKYMVLVKIFFKLL